MDARLRWCGAGAGAGLLQPGAGTVICFQRQGSLPRLEHRRRIFAQPVLVPGTDSCGTVGPVRSPSHQSHVGAWRRFAGSRACEVRPDREKGREMRER